MKLIAHYEQFMSCFVEYKLFSNPECPKKLQQPVIFLLRRVKRHLRYLVCLVFSKELVFVVFEAFRETFGLAFGGHSE